MPIKCTVFSHPDCLRHRPPDGHPENPERLQAVLDALRTLPRLTFRQAPQATREQLLLAHDPGYLDNLEALHASLSASTDPDAVASLDPDTWMNRYTLAAAGHAAGACCAAVDLVLDDRQEITRAFCAVRPTGHHAERKRAMGFCFFAGTAIAALHAVRCYGLERVALVDFDVHLANGSIDILAGNDHISLFESHQTGIFPALPEAATRPANIISKPLPPGCTGGHFRAVWQRHLLPPLEQYRPQLIIISAGFDAHRDDPLAHCRLGEDDFTWITEAVCRIAERHAGGRVVSSLEGGYDLAALRGCVLGHVLPLVTASWQQNSADKSASPLHSATRASS